jgi:hypothetical protein
MSGRCDYCGDISSHLGCADDCGGEGCSSLRVRVAELEEALLRVLSWPLPDGTVEQWALPPWLSQMARRALENHPKEPKE